MFFAEPQFLKRCPLPQSPPDRPLVLHNTLWSDGGSEVSDTSAKSDMSEASPSASRLSGVQPDKRRNHQPSRNQERYRTAGRLASESRQA